MTGDFNIQDNSWDLSFLFHSTCCELINDIVDSMDLYISKPTNQVSTRYSDNQTNLNSVIDLMFLQLYSPELNNYTIYLE